VDLRTFQKGAYFLAGLALLAASGLASPILVNNPSFETLPAGGLAISCGTGCAYDNPGSVPGWTGTTFGQFQPGPPGTTTFFNSVPDGTTIAYSNGGELDQQVGTAVLGTYTLQIDLGLRKDRPVADLGSIQLLIGGNTPVQGLGTAPTGGNWSTYTATYTTTAADVGKPIMIQLTSINDQGDFDNVRLNLVAAAATTEPTSMELIACGFGLLAFTVRRKRA
jgi:hypothetical protein